MPAAFAAPVSRLLCLLRHGSSLLLIGLRLRVQAATSPRSRCACSPKRRPLVGFPRSVVRALPACRACLPTVASRAHIPAALACAAPGSAAAAAGAGAAPAKPLDLFRQFLLHALRQRSQQSSSSSSGGASGAALVRFGVAYGHQSPPIVLLCTLVLRDQRSICFWRRRSANWSTPAAKNAARAANQTPQPLPPRAQPMARRRMARQTLRPRPNPSAARPSRLRSASAGSHWAATNRLRRAS